MDPDQDIEEEEQQEEEIHTDSGSGGGAGAEKNPTAKKSCLVSYDVPPKSAPYGSLAPKTGYYQPTQKGVMKPKRKSWDPQNPTPEGVATRPDDIGPERLVTTESHHFQGPGNVIVRKILHDKENHTFPGWLVELDNPALQTIKDMKNCLAAGKDVCDTAEKLSEMAGTVGAEVSKSEVIEILRRIPYGKGVWSFPHFMLAMGSPKTAREQGIFQDPFPFSEDECKEKEDGDAEGDTGAKNEKAKAKTSQKSRNDRLHQPYKYEKTDTWPLTAAQAKAANKKKAKEMESYGDNDTGKEDTTQYSNREKVFFSGLLIFEMYHTIQAVEQLYFQNENIPDPPEKKLHLEAKRGFGVEDAGTKKLGFAEWDRPLAPVPKTSPYMAIHPFVSTRWKITRPNEKERQHRRTLTKLQPIHLQVKPPTEPKGRIKVMENRGRIKRAMAYLSSQGNCVAMLPFSHYIIHLSDTHLQKLEDVKVRPVKEKMDPVEPNNDWVYLLRDAKNVFFLHGLPKAYAKLPFFIDINRAMKVRKECEKVRKEHWEFIDKAQVEFRNKAWKLMHTERIPCGWLRENFVYTFDAYLPYHADLPIVNDNTPVPL